MCQSLKSMKKQDYIYPPLFWRHSSQNCWALFVSGHWSAGLQREREEKTLRRTDGVWYLVQRRAGGGCWGSCLCSKHTCHRAQWKTITRANLFNWQALTHRCILSGLYVVIKLNWCVNLDVDSASQLAAWEKCKKCRTSGFSETLPMHFENEALLRVDPI